MRTEIVDIAGLGRPGGPGPVAVVVDRFPFAMRAAREDAGLVLRAAPGDG